MNQATSAGGIFVQKRKDKFYLLLLKYPDFLAKQFKSGGLGFLKGHVEPGETVEQTAIREMKEEAGLENVKIVKKIGSLTREATEDNGERVLKTIHMFLMTTDNFDHKPSEEEYDWFEYYEAINNMAFKEEAEFLKQHKNTLTDVLA